MSAQNACGLVLDFLEALGQNHPVRTRLGHHAFASTARVDLCLDHEPTGARFFGQRHRGFVGRFWGVCHFASLNRDAKRLKNAFSLVFVDVHGLLVA